MAEFLRPLLHFSGRFSRSTFSWSSVLARSPRKKKTRPFPTRKRSKRSSRRLVSFRTWLYLHPILYFGDTADVATPGDIGFAKFARRKSAEFPGNSARVRGHPGQRRQFRRARREAESAGGVSSWRGCSFSFSASTLSSGPRSATFSG